MVKQSARPAKPRSRTPHWLLGGLLALLAGAPARADEPVPNAVDALRPQPVRLAIDVFGKTADIEVRDLPRESARIAIEEALHEMFYVSVFADPDGQIAGGLGQLNAAAGGAELTLDRRAFELLIRGLQFCLWSNGVYSPVGGAVYRLWREQASPYPADLQAAVASAGCRQVQIAGGEAGKSGRARLAAGSRIDPVGIAEGFAVDRAADILQKHGARNALISLGRLRRAIGPGTDGKGWLIDVPGLAAKDPPIDQVWLRDQSFSVTRVDDAFRPLDMKTGLPARGTLQVAAVTELAADAQGLTTTLFVFSQSKGQQHLGALQPRPSVHWLIGQSGAPVESTYHWTDLSRPNSSVTSSIHN